MTVVSVEHALSGKMPAGGEVTVRGWVRTRRDAGPLSFVHVSDGSCFAPIQVVATNTLPNYEDEVRHLSAGCAVVARTASTRRCRTRGNRASRPIWTPGAARWSGWAR